MNSATEAPVFGLGGTGLGRDWGVINTQLPTEGEIVNLLLKAHTMGVQFFDTSPSYGSSEERLGLMLQDLTPDQRQAITVETKMGNLWDYEKRKSYSNFQESGLKASIAQSFTRLGIPDIILLHKSTPELVQSPDFKASRCYAKERGVPHLGLSISTIENAKAIMTLLEEDRENLPSRRQYEDLTYLQIPYNPSYEDFAEIIKRSHNLGIHVVTNQVFKSGQTISSENCAQIKLEAYLFAMQQLNSGDVILTGTKSQEHLQEDLLVFDRAIHTQKTTQFP